MPFLYFAEEELLLLKQAAAHAINENAWTVEKLNEERTTNNKCWEAHKHLSAAVARVEDGLVERGEDARLVVLAMIANEHILLLGKPGTGKYDAFIDTPIICIRCFSAVPITMIQLIFISHLYFCFCANRKVCIRSSTCEAL